VKSGELVTLFFTNMKSLWGNIGGFLSNRAPGKAKVILLQENLIRMKVCILHKEEV
jgi:hypothetical protein